MTEIKELLARVIEDFCDEGDYSFYSDYSGRGMYGETCIGISHDDSDFDLALGLAIYIQEHHGDDACDILVALKEESINVDQLGKGRITYWPRLLGAAR